MGLSDIVHQSVTAVRDVLNDVKDKQAEEDARARRIENAARESVSNEAYDKKSAAAERGSLWDDTGFDNNGATLDMWEYPISYEDYIQLRPYEPLFNQYLQEYENEADPIMRMIISDKYTQGPLGSLPLTGMLINDLYTVDKTGADTGQSINHKYNSGMTRQIFNQQMNKFTRNV